MSSIVARVCFTKLQSPLCFFDVGSGDLYCNKIAPHRQCRFSSPLSYRRSHIPKVRLSLVGQGVGGETPAVQLGSELPSSLWKIRVKLQVKFWKRTITKTSLIGLPPSPSPYPGSSLHKTSSVIYKLFN